jgi:hypothetical protein
MKSSVHLIIWHTRVLRRLHDARENLDFFLSLDSKLELVDAIVKCSNHVIISRYCRPFGSQRI